MDLADWTGAAEEVAADALRPEQERQKAAQGQLLWSATSSSAASSPLINNLEDQVWLLGAGHSGKEVAGGGDSNDGLNHARAESCPAQDPESLVLLSMELLGIGSRGGWDKVPASQLQVQGPKLTAG